jgi:hypothetical protein
MHNPNVSEEAKETAAEKVEGLEQIRGNTGQEHKDPTRVEAGLKAALHNPNVSEEAKERIDDRLENKDF